MQMTSMLDIIISMLPVPPGFPSPSPIVDLPIVLPTPNFGPGPAEIANQEFVGQIIGLALLVVGTAIWAVVMKARQTAARRFCADNPDVSIIYNNSRIVSGMREVLEVKKIDGRRAHTVNHGAYVLHGRRELLICRKTYKPKRIDTEKLPEITTDINKGKEYFIEIEEGTERCKLVEITDFGELDEWEEHDGY